MKVVVAIDSFKGSLTSMEAGYAAKAGILNACDVTNPLCGTNGCVYVYGPQKGVKEEEKALMDAMMAHYGQKTVAFTGVDKREVPGTGAAGGLGFAFTSFFPILRGVCTLDEAMKTETAKTNMSLAVEQAFRLLCAR